MSVVIKDRSAQFVAKNAGAMDSALARMTKDIQQLAKIRVPLKTGELQDKIEAIKIAQGQHRVTVNAPYAAYQERGRRRDGSHVVRKYSTPGTGKNYLLDAGEQVKKQATNYFRQASRLAKL